MRVFHVLAGYRGVILTLTNGYVTMSRIMRCVISAAVRLSTISGSCHISGEFIPSGEKPVDDEISVTNEPPGLTNGRGMLNGIQRAFLAGLGAAAVAGSEVQRLTDHLVSRGQTAESESRSLMTRAIDRPRQALRDTLKRAEGAAGRGRDAALGAFNIPTSSEIESLNTRLAELSRKLDELNQSDGR